MFSSLKLKKWTGFLVALLMTISIIAPWASTNAKAAETGKVFDIIEITDFHGSLLDSSSNPVAGVLAQNINDVKKTNPDRTIVIGGGDLYQGSPISNVLQGVPVRKFMDSIGMELTAVGNHEFDWGLDTVIKTTMKDAKYSMISANLYDKTTGKRVFDPYKIVEKDGIKIAFVGGITMETPTIVLPKNVENYEFKDVTTEVNSVAKEIKDGKLADVVIAVLHAGSYDTKTGEVYDIANKLQNVDAVFGGHSHTIVNTTAANGLPIYIANNAGKGFIDAKMTVDSNKKVSFKADYVDIYNDKPNGYKAKTPIQDADVKAIVDAATTEIGPTFNEVIGTAPEDLKRTQLGTPYGESFLGNWNTEVMKKKVNADVAFQNNGGLRIDIPKGNITVGTIYSFMPFDNVISTINMTKAEIKTVLEQAFMDGGKGIQIAGLKVKYDPAKPSMNRVVEITREDGTAISDTQTLKVATNDFMAQGGDGFKGFLDANGKYRYEDTHIIVRDALKDDVIANKKITATMNTRIENVAKYIQVVATSDLHGNIYPLDYFANKPSDLGLAKVSTYVKGLKAKNANVILIDNGDTIQGTPLVTYYNSIDTKAVYPMMKVMGAMGYDSWTLGNHEFNFGLTTLDRIIKDAKDNKINVLSANVVKTSGGTYVEPYFIKEFNVNGKIVKVGVLGLTTKNVPGWEDPAHYAGLKFNDLVDDAKYWVPIMREKGADVVIVSAHSGEEGAADLTEENQIKAIATKVSGIDAIVAGHVHNVVADLTLMNPEGKVVPVVEPGKYAQNVSLIRIPVGTDGKVGAAEISNVKMDASVVADQAILDLAKPYQDATLEYVKTKIGVSTAEYTGEGQTMKPTAIMELINKVQMQGAKTQLSIAAPLSASARIPSGDITIQDIMSVYVYENFLYGVKMNGKQIKDWMELSVKYYKQVKNATDPIVKDPELNIADYNLDQLYGMSYDIDLTQPVGQRIKNMKYNGKLVKDTDIFTVAINNYRYNGGGGFMKAAGLSSIDPSIVTYDSAKALGDDGQVRSMMIKYIQDNKTITPSVEDNWKVYTTTVKQEGQQVVPTQPTTQPTAKVIEYIVKPGDVLWRIAQKYGVTYKQVGEYNKLTNYNLIHVGQKLLIPAN